MPHVPRRSTILIVDDEAVVTRSFRAFLELETRYVVIEAQSPAKALDIIRETRIDVVISDFLMPEMNGLQFLAAVKRMFPDVPRIMLTGYADKENSIRAINEIGLFHYLEKPWDNNQLKLIIDNAVAHKSLQETLARRIHELDSVSRERNRVAVRDELLREELALARRLQESMLPDLTSGAGVVHFAAHYEPAFEVGGDFYDVIPLANDQVAVLVADTTGHGIQAALSTAIVKFAFTRFTNCETTPRDILAGMNGVLVRGLPEDILVAGLVAVIDASTATCEIVNAGLPHPFVLRRGARQVERVCANGFMLGLLEDALYTPDDPQVVHLQHGDSLLLYTDGLSEIENAVGEQFDFAALGHNLREHIARPVPDLIAQIVEAGRSFGTPSHEWDDVTVFGIDRR